MHVMSKYMIDLQLALICIEKKQKYLKRIIGSKLQTKYTKSQMQKVTNIETLSFQANSKDQQLPITTTNNLQQQKSPEIKILPSQLDDLFGTQAQHQSYSSTNLIEQYNYLIYPSINDNFQNLLEMDGYRYDDEYYSQEDLISKAQYNLSTANLEGDSYQRKLVPEKSNNTKKQDVNCKNFYQNIFKILQIIFRSVQNNIENNIPNPDKYRNVQKILKTSNAQQLLQLQQIIQGLSLSDTRTNFLVLLKNKYMKAIIVELLLNNQIYMKSYLCRIKLRNRNAFNRKLKNLVKQVIRN